MSMIPPGFIYDLIKIRNFLSNPFPMLSILDFLFVFQGLWSLSFGGIPRSWVAVGANEGVLSRWARSSSRMVQCLALHSWGEMSSSFAISLQNMCLYLWWSVYALLGPLANMLGTKACFEYVHPCEPYIPTSRWRSCS